MFTFRLFRQPPQGMLPCPPSVCASNPPWGIPPRPPSPFSHQYVGCCPAIQVQGLEPLRPPNWGIPPCPQSPMAKTFPSAATVNATLYSKCMNGEPPTDQHGGCHPNLWPLPTSTGDTTPPSESKIQDLSAHQRGRCRAVTFRWPNLRG